MSETLPVPAGIPAGMPPEVLLTALARAAAELAAQEGARRRELEPLDRAAIEDIATRCAEVVVRELFASLDVDLDDKEARRSFRDDLRHAHRTRTWWDKAGLGIGAALVSSIAATLIAAVSGYLKIGGVK